MFDTNKIAKNIKSARTKMNMTQMNLADEMGVSYQAVSNWERGNSMPDISKLPELCKILNISFEELVGEKNAETDVAEKLMRNDDADVSLDDIAKVGPLVEPEKIERKVHETMEREEKISFSTIMDLAPFMDKETLGQLAEKVADVDMDKLSALAPFLSKEALDKIVDNSIQNDKIDMDHILAIVPFLSKSSIQRIADYLIKHNQSEKLIAIAPFMGKEMFSSQIKNMFFGTKKSSQGDDGSDDYNLDELDETQVEELAFGALEKGKSVCVYLDYMDEEGVARLAFRALELDKNTDVYLDYMDEDDIFRLASKSLEMGKDIERYLDHMDEDAVRKLLLQATKR